MENIFYLNAKKSLEKFLNKEFDSCPQELLERFFNYFTNLISAEEEGQKLHPMLMFTNDIKAISESIPSSYSLCLFDDKSASYFDARMKALMPFTNEEWWIYICPKGKTIEYGIIKATNSIKDPTFKELLFKSKEIKSKKETLDIVLVEPFSNFVVNLASLSGKELNVYFSFDENLNKSNVDDVLNQFTEATFSKCTSKGKKISELQTMFMQILKTVTRKVHGAICVVIDKSYVDDGFFSDGVWLKNPIDMSKLYQNTKSYQESVLESVAELIITMLNFDGITIVDNTGCVRAYNVFIESDMEKTRDIIGGARKRAAYTIINGKRTRIIGVYFQSHEGEIFYEEAKGYKKRKNAAKAKSKVVEEPSDSSDKVVEEPSDSSDNEQL